MWIHQSKGDLPTDSAPEVTTVATDVATEPIAEVIELSNCAETSGAASRMIGEIFIVVAVVVDEANYLDDGGSETRFGVMAQNFKSAV